jgi:HlyD family secretion protein
VAEVLVKEGDEVKEGDALFTYDTQEMEENLAQAEIDLDRLANEIEQTTEQIASLKKEKASASSDQQLNYTTQINTAENEIKRNEYEQKSKKVEIEKLKNSIANATVTSEMDGVIKSINDSDDSSSSLTGESEAFMTILATGTFRIKGTVNEQNASAIVEGQAVLVHSRVDDTVWKGTLTSVDFDNPEKDDSSYYYSSSDSSTDSSSNYPFYVDLESADGLMLGQHVYIEMDYGKD